VFGRSGKTGFEESKDFPIRLGAVVAGRYQLMEYLGSAAFSKAVQALDLHTGLMVCIKIIKNNKDFFDQVRELVLMDGCTPSGRVGVWEQLLSVACRHWLCGPRLTRAHRLPRAV